MGKKYTGLLLILPWIIGFVVFTAFPFLASFVLSFTDYTIIDPPEFSGLSNYVQMFFKDPDFKKSVAATFLYVGVTVPLKLIFALFIAFVLNFRLKGISFFRTAFYIPSILGGNVAIAVLWTFLFSSGGLINQALAIFNIPAVPFFAIPFTAMLSMSLLRVWQFGSAMVIFFAALRDIPQTLYDAAAVDGATRVRVGVLALPQFCVQAGLYLCASLIMPLTTPDMLADFSACGGLIMLATGFRICSIKQFPVANMLPALLLVMPLSWLWAYYLG